MNNSAKKAIKRELRDAAIEGVNAYLRTIRGCNMLPKARVTCPDTATIQIEVPDENGPTFFTLKVKEQV